MINHWVKQYEQNTTQVQGGRPGYVYIAEARWANTKPEAFHYLADLLTAGGQSIKSIITLHHYDTWH